MPETKNITIEATVPAYPKGFGEPTLRLPKEGEYYLNAQGVWVVAKNDHNTYHKIALRKLKDQWQDALDLLGLADGWVAVDATGYVWWFGAEPPPGRLRLVRA